MDKKIILSILIVAFIGIVAATYQIDIDNDTFNPLASVTPEDTPVTDALAAPASDGDSANTAQQQAQAQQQADQANTQQQAQDNSENQGNSTGDSDNTGNTESSGALINSENPVNTPSSDGGDSDTGSTGGTSDTDGGSGSPNGRSDSPRGGSGSPREESQDIITQTPPRTVDPTPFDTGLTLTQANNIVQKSGLNIVVDYTSVQTTTGKDGVTYYVYLVRYADAKPGDEPVHLYVSKTDGTMFIYEEASHADVAPVDESDQSTDTDQSTDVDQSTDTNSTT